MFKPVSILSQLLPLQTIYLVSFLLSRRVLQRQGTGVRPKSEPDSDDCLYTSKHFIPLRPSSHPVRNHPNFQAFIHPLATSSAAIYRTILPKELLRQKQPVI